MIFTQDEADTISRTFRRDQFLRELASQQDGLKALNNLLTHTSTGPVSLFITWNGHLIDGWAKANAAMDPIAKATTCNDIAEQVVASAMSNSPNGDFFQDLLQARGCGK